MSYPKIINPEKLDQSKIDGEVVGVGEVFNYKPSLAKLSDDELLMFTIHWHREADTAGGRLLYHTVMYRSHDGGKSWSDGQHMPFDGHEPSASVIDGVIFVHTHLFHFNPFYTTVMLYRSADNGESWTSIEIKGEDFPEREDKNASPYPCRNLVKLKSGEILWGLQCSHDEYRVVSKDLGLNWSFEKMTPDDAVIEYYNKNCDSTMTSEAVTFYSPSGRLLRMSRIEWQRIQSFDVPYKIEQKDAYCTDAGDGSILLESKDDGRTWKVLRGVGIVGMMYPSFINISDDSFIFQYTMRILPEKNTGYPFRHMGVHAIIVKELPDGSFDFNFDRDLIVIDDRTPDIGTQGGGFGLIYRLSDGTLLSPYSYRELTPWMIDALENERWKDREFMETVFRRVGRSTLSWKRWLEFPDDQRIEIFVDLGIDTRDSLFYTQLLRWKM